jgi:hypothetical protein
MMKNLIILLLMGVISLSTRGTKGVLFRSNTRIFAMIFARWTDIFFGISIFFADANWEKFGGYEVFKFGHNKQINFLWITGIPKIHTNDPRQKRGIHTLSLKKTSPRHTFVSLNLFSSPRYFTSIATTHNLSHEFI